MYTMLLSVELSNIRLIFFWFFLSKIDFLALFLGKRGPPCENIGRDLHFAPVVGPFWPLQKILKNRDLEINKKNRPLTSLTEFIWPLPEALAGGKTEPPDYILMFSSADVPGIP